MKAALLLMSLLMLSGSMQAQYKNYNVVFDFSNKDTINQRAIIRELALIKKANPAAQLEVVIYGQGLDLVVKGKSQQETEVGELANEKGISFKVCQQTLKRNNMEGSSLISGVQMVPDGIYEIISKQREGWGYIKVSH
ncbi:DsrE family protein [Niabella soli]|uniref:Uncharacterized protein n=1 Tax=Niabella soli DSM 19437 TaxID=929713 RepID=W0F0V6_9BACT|nr:DsrE family protein [Niabella soli]AHF14976.1 hypothetical protein NIASO_07015 [Niabella soli DSM 19437]